jgi:hypothetical protein
VRYRTRSHGLPTGCAASHLRSACTARTPSMIHGPGASIQRATAARMTEPTNSAQRIIAKFGGQCALAKLLSRTQSTVQHWWNTGSIPAKWQARLLALAEEHGVVLEPADFMWSATALALVPAQAAAVVVRDESAPVAKYKGVLSVMGMEIPCYVLSSGQRVVGRTSFAETLSNIKGGGALEEYLRPAALKPWINIDLVLEGMVPFRLPEVEGLGTDVKGLPADMVIDICRGFVAALDANSRGDIPGGVPKMTERQKQIAVRAGMFVSACAKAGLDALIERAPAANGEIHGMISGPGVFWHYRVTATSAQTQVHVLTPPRSSAREAVRLQNRFLRDVLDRVHQEQSDDVRYPKRVDGEFYLLRQSPGMHVSHRHCQAAITTGALDRRFVEQIQAWNLALLRP